MISNVIVGIITGIGAAWISLWQARSLSLWEKREEAYLDVLNALQVMLRVNEKWCDAEMHHRELAKSIENELASYYREARAKIERHADLGAYLSSPSTEEALAKLTKLLGKEYDTLFESLDAHGYAIRNALAEVKRAALADRRSVPLAWLRSVGRPRIP